MRGGARPGSGRKKGVREPQTLEREKIAEAYAQRVFKISDHLLNKQLVLANGQQFLYRIDTDSKGKRSKPVLVESSEEIQMYLEDPDAHDEDHYYYITTKEPNGQAIDSMLNRGLGKPKETVEHIGEMKLKVDV